MRLMDAVAGGSSSGPVLVLTIAVSAIFGFLSWLTLGHCVRRYTQVYVFQFIEAMSDGSVRAGLPRPVATQLAAQTLLGAARMVLETGEHPVALKDQVRSPGGTTIAAVHQLELGGMRGSVINAVLAAAEKSKELGQK